MHYDVIIIGSGLGGLTCGAFLARGGKRVLVLEKHSKIGGYAHHFKRRDYIFESGIHSVPMGENGIIRHFLRLLDIDDRISTIPFPSMYSVSTPDGILTMPSEPAAIRPFLETTFPHERAGIEALFIDMKMVYDTIVTPIRNYETAFVPEDAAFVSQFHNKTYGAYLDSLFTDPHLKTLIGGQWPYGGTVPTYGPHLFYFMMFSLHCMEGSHFVQGGFAVLAQSLASVITHRGGAVKTGAEVITVAGTGKLAKTVHTIGGDTYTADIIISNIAPYALNDRILDEPLRGKFTRRRLSNLSPSVSCVIVYLGMKKGFEQFHLLPIVFQYDSDDFTTIFENIRNNCKLSIDHLVSLRSIEEGDHPTLTLMNFVQDSFSEHWKADKKVIADRMVERAKKLYPGIEDYIEVIETGSPRTFERYTGNTGGALYGFENTATMYGEAKMSYTTHLENVWQVGHWGRPGCGVWNVMTNGYTVARMILAKIK